MTAAACGAPTTVAKVSAPSPSSGPIAHDRPANRPLQRAGDRGGARRRQLRSTSAASTRRSCRSARATRSPTRRRRRTASARRGGGSTPSSSATRRTAAAACASSTTRRSRWSAARNPIAGEHRRRARVAARARHEARRRDERALRLVRLRHPRTARTTRPPPRPAPTTTARARSAMSSSRASSRSDFPKGLDASIIFVAVASEEQGLNGSRQLAEWLHEKGYKVVAGMTDDIVGNVVAEDGNTDSTSMRIFAADPDNSPSRELGRYVWGLNRVYLPNFEVLPVWRLDRIGRGGDHEPYVTLGDPGLRFTERVENYNRQHLPTDDFAHVNFGYVANVARVNAMTVASLAIGAGDAGERARDASRRAQRRRRRRRRRTGVDVELGGVARRDGLRVADPPDDVSRRGRRSFRSATSRAARCGDSSTTNGPACARSARRLAFDGGVDASPECAARRQRRHCRRRARRGRRRCGGAPAEPVAEAARKGRAAAVRRIEQTARLGGHALAPDRRIHRRSREQLRDATAAQRTADRRGERRRLQQHRRPGRARRGQWKRVRGSFARERAHGRARRARAAGSAVRRRGAGFARLSQSAGRVLAPTHGARRQDRGRAARMRNLLAPAHLALTVIILIWDIVLAGRIAQNRQAPSVVPGHVRVRGAAGPARAPVVSRDVDHHHGSRRVDDGLGLARRAGPVRAQSVYALVRGSSPVSSFESRRRRTSPGSAFRDSSSLGAADRDVQRADRGDRHRPLHGRARPHAAAAARRAARARRVWRWFSRAGRRACWRRRSI